MSKDELFLFGSYFAEMAKKSHDVFWIKGPDYKSILYVSPAYEEIVGCFYEKTNKTSGLWDICIFPADRILLKEIDQARKSCVKSDSAFPDVFFRIIRSNGEPCWLRESCYALFDDKGYLKGFIGTARDISEEKSQEKRLLTANAYFAHFVEKSESVYWVLDTACQKQLYLSPAYEKIWGRKRENLYNNPGTWIETVHPDDREANTANSRLLMLLENGPQTYYESEYRIVRPDGEIRWIKDISFPIYANKECIGFAGIAEDVTKEKNHNQSLLEAKEKAEQANRAKTEFLSMVSHELRIPLTGILGTAKLLALENLSNTHNNQVKDIIFAGEHLLALVNDLLDIAKLEEKKVELHIEPMNLHKILEEIIALLNPQAKIKNLELLLDYKHNTPHIIMSDIKILKQITLNLVGNALKFTEKGTIIITVDCTFRENQKIDLALSVADTGIGIPQDKLNTIFERFEQAGETVYKRLHGGVGLGLTITKKYLETMNGHIEVKSTLGEGSTFTCSIPTYLPTNTTDESFWTNGKSSIRILIITDDNIQAKILQQYFLGFTIKIISGRDTISTLMNSQQSNLVYDIIIIDEQLTTITSNNLLLQIKKNLSFLPMTVLLTQTNGLKEVEHVKSLGFDSALLKSTQPGEFMAHMATNWKKWLEAKEENSTFLEPKKIKVLLVEDDPIVQKVHSMMLEKVGCEVDLAIDGPEALQKYNNKYDLIFMDIGLPKMSGLEVIQEIRAKEEISREHITIIAATGYAHDRDKKNCLSAGADSVVTKPMDFDALENIINEWKKKP